VAEDGVGHQVSLELGDIHVQRTIEPQRCSQRRADLTQQLVEVGVSEWLDIQSAAADDIPVALSTSIATLGPEGSEGHTGKCFGRNHEANNSKETQHPCLFVKQNLRNKNVPGSRLFPLVSC